MDTHLWADRMKRVTNKIIWSAHSSVITKPRIDIIHQRVIPGDSESQEFVRRCLGPAYIEPVFGYIIDGTGHLIEDSLLPNFPFPKPPWRVGLASANDFFKAQRGNGKRIEYYPSVIHLRHFWEWNYYHFYLDVLGKLRLFDEVGIDPSTPIVLGHYAMELPFVKEAISQGDLKRREWIIQDDSYVLADEIYYCRTQQSYKDKMDYLMDIMDIPNHQYQYNDRIFLTRKPGGPRSVLNMDQVDPILREYNFRIVDTAGMPLTKQIEIFSKTRYLLALHGAGMTNMIFRRDAPLSVLEIYATHVSEDFRNMCHEWGYKIDRLASDTDDWSNIKHAKIYIHPTELRKKIEHLLDDDI